MCGTWLLAKEIMSLWTLIRSLWTLISVVRGFWQKKLLPSHPLQNVKEGFYVRNVKECVCVCIPRQRAYHFTHALTHKISHSLSLLQCQKRPTTVSKETYYSVKRDLLQCQKRHNFSLHPPHSLSMPPHSVMIQH